MSGRSLRIGLVPFDLPPFYERGAKGGAKTSILPGLVAELEARTGRRVELVEPLAGRQNGVSTPADVELCARELRARGADCLLLDLFHWTRLALAVALLRELDLPSALLANTRGGWNGITAVTAISGSLRETAQPRNLRRVERFRDTQPQEVLDWLQGIAAYAALKRSRLLEWGGGYGADMPFSRGDPAALEAALVREVLAEDQLVLVERARAIQSGDPRRLERFVRWLEQSGVRILPDGGRLTSASLGLQVALYLAARDRLAEMEGEDIAGVAIKCHYELSIAPVGCTACFLPAFLPYPEDAEGPRAVVPTACEGDLYGLAGLAILHAVNPRVPPLFGDLAMIEREYVLLRNCGASSAHWAGGLDRLEVRPNLHGKSGGALHYETPAEPEVTFARLFRTPAGLALMLGEGEVAAETPESSFPDPWPHTRLRLPADPGLFFRAAPCNHGSLTRGSLARPLEALARQAGLAVVRCDDDAALRSYLEAL